MMINNDSSMHKTPRIFIYLIVFIVFLCYHNVLRDQFVWDDRVNFVGNPHFRGLGLSNLLWMTTTCLDANFHPLLWATFGIDYILWGMNPAGYHLTNLLIHVLNTVLVFFLIPSFIRPQEPSEQFQPSFEMKTAAAAFVGALFFGIHPLRVEPVSWLSARGDLLCCFFYLPAVMAYLKMAKNTDNAAIKKKWLYIALFFFILSLLSRAWAVTLPVVLLLMDIYPLGRPQGQRPIIQSYKKILFEKTPFFIFSLIFGIAAVSAKKTALTSIADHSFLERLMQSIFGAMHYPWKTLVPIALSPLYLLNENTYNPFELKYIESLFLFIGIGIILTINRKRHKWLLTAFAIYLATVFPLLGFFQAGPQIVADRYSYISCIPFAVLAAAGMFKIFNFIRRQQPGIIFRILIFALPGVGLLFSGVLSYQQVSVWKNEIALWNHVLKLDPKNYYAYYGRGVELEKINNIHGALDDYDNAIKFNPEYPRPYNNRGVIRMAQNDLEGADEDFRKSIELNPAYAEAHANLGVLLYKKNDYLSAINQFNMALSLAPADWPNREMASNFIDKMRPGQKADNRK
jgi:protein O-mannosyl-transferase